MLQLVFNKSWLFDHNVFLLTRKLQYKENYVIKCNSFPEHELSAFKKVFFVCQKVENCLCVCMYGSNMRHSGKFIYAKLSQCDVFTEKLYLHRKFRVHDYVQVIWKNCVTSLIRLKCLITKLV